MLGHVVRLGVPVAGRRLHGHVQRARPDAARQGEGAAQPPCPAASVEEEVLGRGGHVEHGGIAPPVVELLALGRHEGDLESHLPGGELGRRPLGPAGRAVDPLGVLGKGDPGEPVGGRLDDDEAGPAALGITLDHRVARLGQVAGQGGDLPGGRVVAADRPVVGVADGDRPVGELGDAEWVLQEGLGCGSVTVAEVEQARSHMGLDGEAAGVVDRDGSQGGRLAVGDPHAPPVGGGAQP